MTFCFFDKDFRHASLGRKLSLDGSSATWTYSVPLQVVKIVVVPQDIRHLLSNQLAIF